MRLLIDLLLLSIGAGLGIMTLCMVQMGNRYDKNMENFREKREDLE